MKEDKTGKKGWMELIHVIECKVLHGQAPKKILLVCYCVVQEGLCKNLFFFLLFLSGSPAELSPSILSPVNHGMGKTLLTA